MTVNEQITKYADCVDDEQLGHAERMLETDHDNIALIEWVAFMYYTHGNYDRAIELYGRLVTIDGRNEGHHYYLANSFYRTKRLTLARIYWTKAIQTNPHGKFAGKAQQLLGSLATAAVSVVSAHV